MNRVVQILFNKMIFKSIYISFIALNMLPLINVQPASRIILGFLALWGMCIILRDFLSSGWKYYKKQGIMLMVCFLCICAISYLIKFSTYGTYSLLSLGFSVISVVLLFTNDYTDKQQMQQEIRLVGFCFCLVVLVAMLISVVWFFMQKHFVITARGGYDIYLGFFQNRLYGLFSSPNVGGTYAVLGGAMALLNLFCFSRSERFKIIESIFYIVYLAATCLFLPLTSSRGTMLCLIIGISIFLIFAPLPMQKARPYAFSSILLRITAIFVSVACVFVVMDYMPKVMAYAPPLINSWSEDQNSQDGKITPLDMQRIEEGREDIDISNKRFSIWTAYGKLLKNSPLIGVDPLVFTQEEAEQYVRAGVLTEEDAVFAVYATGNTHNGYLHVAVQGGIIAFGLFIAFLIQCIYKTMRAKVTFGRDRVIAIMIALMAYIIANNMVESNVLLMGANVFQAVFWLYAGYLLTYIRLSQEETEEIT